MGELKITKAGSEDRHRVLALLEAAGLPRQGLEASWGTTLVARRGGRTLGCAALELHGAAAVLRSVAVARAARGAGAGGALVDAAIELARGLGLGQIWLLTETAAPFFEGLGFAAAERGAAPVAVRESIEFTALCPASATAMVLRLSPGEATCATTS